MHTLEAALKDMPTKLVSDDGKHMVIRPLAYVKEEDTERYAAVKGFPIIPCDLCGFTDIKADGLANPLGDIAFDEEPCAPPAAAAGTIALQRA